MTGIEKAIHFFGGLTHMARALGLSGYQVVQQWRESGRVPAPYGPVIERLTDGAVICEELDDRVDWAYIRRGGARSELALRAACRKQPGEAER